MLIPQEETVAKLFKHSAQKYLDNYASAGMLTTMTLRAEHLSTIFLLRKIYGNTA
jgi:hypothetical protein